MRGSAYLKGRLSQTVTLDVELLPANPSVVAYAEAEKRRGGTVILATAANSLIARRIARRFDFIDEVIGTENGVNLKGAAKAQRLAELYPDGFTYVGDSGPDLKIWAVAKSAVVVSRSKRLERRAGKVSHVDQRFAIADAGRAMLRAMRPHQWAKNALVFAPLILAGMADRADAPGSRRCSPSSRSRCWRRARTSSTICSTCRTTASTGRRSTGRSLPVHCRSPMQSFFAARCLWRHWGLRSSPARPCWR